MPLTYAVLQAGLLAESFSHLNMLGGGYLYGLPLGFVADSLGATFGATAAFFLGRTAVVDDRRGNASCLDAIRGMMRLFCSEDGVVGQYGGTVVVLLERRG
ncbi:hypothetical protein KSP40_PGU016772 [Platanthera guangdongensis]|uniref:Uncharacterized protein n=1 Tax=Platanthera guangdongensis TaxID=2320717 RepID=A0ABR2M890_9ASPA